MSHDLIKNKTLQSFIPPSQGSPGSAAVPARPAYTVVEEYTQRYLVHANQLIRLGPNQWKTPLDILRQLTGRQLTAEQAHYADRWELVSFKDKLERMPVWCTSAWIDIQTTRTVTYPATPYIPAVPGTPDTPARYSYDMHLGWNAGAHSLRELSPAWYGTIHFSIDKTTVGAVVGLASSAQVATTARSGFEDIDQALMFGDGRIRMRNGSAMHDIAPMSNYNTIRIEVANRASVWYLNEQEVWRSRYAPTQNFVLAAALYAGDDAVLSPKIEDGIAGNGDDAAHIMLAPFVSSSSSACEPWTVRARLRGLSVFAGEGSVAQVRAALAPLKVKDQPLTRATAWLSRWRVHGSDQRNDGVLRSELPAVTAHVEVEKGEQWTPQYAMGSAIVMPSAVQAIALAGQVHSYTLRMGGLQVRASQDAYGQAQTRLAALQATVDVEAITNEVRAMNMMSHEVPTQWSGYVGLVLYEKVGIDGRAAIAAEGVLLRLPEKMGVQDKHAISGRILAALREEIGVAVNLTTLFFKDETQIEDGSAWAVNTITNASSRYENYSFNSFMRVGDKHFGIKTKGVYALEGSTDVGQEIDWSVHLGAQDFGSQQRKHVRAVYAGVSSTGQLLLKVNDGSGQYQYLARKTDPRQSVQRFDTGRGLQANYFTFELLGKGSVELDGVEFQVVALNRRI